MLKDSHHKELTSQSSDSRAVMELRDNWDYTRNKNLVSGLFSAFENDQNLRLVVKSWSELPEHIKAAIETLIQTHTSSKRK